MKTIIFPAWCRFGKLDSGETCVEVNLTDEEYERIKAFATNPEHYASFEDTPEIYDIYERIYAIAVKQIEEELKDWGDYDEDMDYECGVRFPEAFD